MTVEQWEQVQQARIAFEARWQPCSLAVVNNGFYERFRDQLDLWNEAYATGDVEDIEIQAGGMVRAYEAAIKLLEGHHKTAFMIGHDRSRGTFVCISAHSESLAYAKQTTVDDIEWITPEAVARLVGIAREMGIAIEDKEDRLS